MTETPESSVSTASRLVTTLRELISALDRRAAHVERSAETRIARDAQVLRREAVAQIEALSREGPDHTPYDLELVEAVMTDDGGPPEGQADTRSSDGVWKQIELPLLTPVADMLGVR